MAQIDEKYLNQLRLAGLFVSHPLGAFMGGVWVVKPTTTPGNNIPGYSSGYISLGDEPLCPDNDAPMLKFMHRDDIWIVDGILSCGGMGPADFIDTWKTPDEAVQDILDYYFGDPARMQKKAAEEEKFRARCEALKNEKASEAQSAE
jgi:hypothetical protein